MSREEKPKRFEFKARIYNATGGFLCLDLPENSNELLGKRGRVPVIGSLNGRSVRTSVFPTGEGSHFMLVNKKIQSELGVKDGDEIHAVLKVDAAPRQVTVPSDLQEALAGSKEAREVFDKLSYTHGKEYISWIEEAKRPETRSRGVSQTIERLFSKS